MVAEQAGRDEQDACHEQPGGPFSERSLEAEDVAGHNAEQHRGYGGKRADDTSGSQVLVE
jgi:hypothetical protein